MEPWSPWAWVRRAWLSAYQGDDDAALREMQMTLRLMPFEPMRHLTFIGMGCVHFNAGRYDRAARWVQAGIEAGPQSYWAERVLVAAAVHAGAKDEARRHARKLLRKDKNLTVAGARAAWPFVPSLHAAAGRRACDCRRAAKLNFPSQSARSGADAQGRACRRSGQVNCGAAIKHRAKGGPTLAHRAGITSTLA